MLNLVSSKMTGIPGISGYSQVHDYLPEDGQKKELRGHLFAVISTSRFENGIEGVASGREIITRLHEEYFGDLSTRPFNALKLAVEKVAGEFVETFGDIEIAAAAFVEGTTYCACFGGSSAVILRDGGLAIILESDQTKTSSASGYPKSGDLMILGTKKFFERISQGILKANLLGGDIQASAEAFTQIIHGEVDSGNIAATILKFTEESQVSAYIQETPIQISNIKSKVQGNLNKLGRFFNNAIKSLPQRKIYIKETPEFEMESQSKKLTLSIGVILLLILGISIVFGIRQKSINELKSKYEGTLTEASQELDEAIGLVGVSPDRARELFISAQEKLNQVESFGAKDSKIDELRAKIEEQKSTAFGEYKASPELFLDLTLLSSGFKGDKLSSSEGNLFILDKNGKKIVSVEISSKKSKVVAGPDKTGEVSDLASYSDRVFTLTADGVKEIDSDVSTVVNKEWEGEALTYGFAGNLYVLDKSANQIYRYAGSGDTFGSKQNWLSASTKPDFSSAKSWVIDGAVYVLNESGKVQKFSLGSPQAFSISGVYPQVSSVDAIYSSDETEFIYMLDKQGKRVVVLDKKGNYKAQYTSDEIQKANSLVVSEEDKKIILLTGEKLLSIEIKH